MHMQFRSGRTHAVSHSPTYNQESLGRMVLLKASLEHTDVKFSTPNCLLHSSKHRSFQTNGFTCTTHKVHTVNTIIDHHQRHSLTRLLNYYFVTNDWSEKATLLTAMDKMLVANGSSQVHSISHKMVAVAGYFIANRLPYLITRQTEIIVFDKSFVNSR